MFDIFIRTQDEFTYLCMFINLTIKILGVLIGVSAILLAFDYNSMLKNKNTFHDSSITKSMLNKRLGIIISLLLIVLYISYYIATSKISVAIEDNSVKTLNIDDYVISRDSIVNKKQELLVYYQ